MNQRDWVRLLTPDEKKVLAFALADQDRVLDHDGEHTYYANVTDDTGRIVELEDIRQSIIEELSA